MAAHDIIRKLRAYTRHPMMGGNTSAPQVLLDEAADEIERLRTALRNTEEALTDAPDLQDNEQVRLAEKIIEDALNP